MPGVFGLVNGIDPGGSAAGFGGPSLADAWGLHANYLEIIRPTLLFEAKVGKLYFNTESLPETYGQNVATVYGLQGINIDDRTSGLPNFAVAGYTTLGDPRFVPILLKNNTWQAQATLTNVRGAHNLGPASPSCGGRWRRSRATTAPGSTPSPPRRPTTAPAAAATRRRRSCSAIRSTVARAHLVVDTDLRHLGAERVRPGRLARHRLADPEPRRCATTSSRRSPRRTARSRTSTSTRCSSSSPARTAPATPPASRPTTATSRRGSALRPRCATGTVVRGGYGLSFFPSSMASQRRAAQHAVHLHLRGDQRRGIRRRAQRVLLHAAADAGPGHADGGRHHRRRRHRPQVELPASVQRDGGAAGLGRLGDGRLRRLAGAADVDGRCPNLNYAPPGAGAVNPRRYYAAVGAEPDHAAAARAAPASRTTTRCSWPSRAARAAASPSRPTTRWPRA